MIVRPTKEKPDGQKIGRRPETRQMVTEMKVCPAVDPKAASPSVLSEISFGGWGTLKSDQRAQKQVRCMGAAFVIRTATRDVYSGTPGSR